jgi:hypothetical protein
MLNYDAEQVGTPTVSFCRGESKRLVAESPWSQFTSERQRFAHPPRLDK